MFYTDRTLSNWRKLAGLIQKENNAQLTKWGIQSHTLDKWMTILTEEVGELAKAILERDSDNPSKDVVKEAIQVATLALKIAEMNLHK